MAFFAYKHYRFLGLATDKGTCAGNLYRLPLFFVRKIIRRFFMKNKLLLALLITLCTLCSAFGFAACGGNPDSDSGNKTDNEHTLKATEGLKFEAIEEDGNVTGYYVAGIGTATDTDIVIPQTYNSKPVTEIFQSAFYACISLTSITIPNSVTKIGYFAFQNCYSLKSITIPDSITYLNGSAFSKCSSLININLSENNACYAIQNGIIYNKQKTELVYVPQTFKDGFVISDGVTKIKNFAFINAPSIKNITIPNSVTEIEFSAFTGCISLTNINIPNSVTKIAHAAFEGCASLSSINIPYGITKIDNSAFRSCTSLTNISIPDSITEIDYAAFEVCASLTNIIIPNNVTFIGDRAFYGCTALTNITFKGTKSQWKAIKKYGFWNSNTGNYTVHCTDGDIEKSAD